MKHLEPKKTDVPSNPLTILTATELSEYLRVHPVTINRLVHSQIPAFRVGSEWRFDIGMIDRTLEKSAMQSAREITSARSRASPLLGGGSAVSNDHPESATSVTLNTGTIRLTHQQASASRVLAPPDHCIPKASPRAVLSTLRAIRQHRNRGGLDAGILLLDARRSDPAPLSLCHQHHERLLLLRRQPA